MIAAEAQISAPPAITVACTRKSHDFYGVPPVVLKSIRKIEGGERGKTHRNQNGTLDYGIMQINTVWIDRLAGKRMVSIHGRKVARYRYRPAVIREKLLNDDCYNLHAGAWVLSLKMQEYRKKHPTANESRWWRSIAAFHSMTPEKNAPYANRVKHLVIEQMVAHSDDLWSY